MMGKVFFSILCVWSWIGRVGTSRLLLALAGRPGWARLGGGGAEYYTRTVAQKDRSLSW